MSQYRFSSLCHSHILIVQKTSTRVYEWFNFYLRFFFRLHVTWSFREQHYDKTNNYGDT